MKDQYGGCPSLLIWDRQTGEIEGSLSREGGPCVYEEIAFSFDGKIVVACDGHGVLAFWDFTSRMQIKKDLERTEKVFNFSLSPVENVIAILDEKSICTWDLSTGLHRDWRTDPKGPVSCLRYSPDGQRIAVGFHDGAIRMLDIAMGEFMEVYKESAKITGLAFSPDSKFICFSSLNSETLRFCDTFTKQELDQAGKELHCPTAISSFGYTLDGQCILSTGADGRVYSWTLADKNDQTLLEANKLNGSYGPSTIISCSPDERYFVTVSGDRDIRLWSVLEALQESAWEEYDGSSHTNMVPADVSLESADMIRQRTASDHMTITDTCSSESVFRSITPESISEDGWHKDENGRLLFWIPPEYRTGTVELAKCGSRQTRHDLNFWARFD